MYIEYEITTKGSVFCACQIMKARQMKSAYHHEFQEAQKQYFVVFLLTDSSTDSAIKILTFVAIGSKSSSNNFSFPHPGHRVILQMPYLRLNNSACKYQDITGSMTT